MFTYYRHDIIQSIIEGFGTLFNNIWLARLDSNGVEVDRFKVPIAYGPKQKFLVRANQSTPDLIHNFEMSLPRLAYELRGLAYAPDRKQPHVKRTAGYTDTEDYMKMRLARAPYDLQFTLHIMTKNSDDAFCILEQILPTFGPDFVITFTDFPIDNKADVPISLSAVTLDEQYEGDANDRKVTIFMLDFVAHANLYGYVPESKIITKTKANFMAYDTMYVAGTTATSSGFESIVYGFTGATFASVDVNVTGGATAGSFGPTGTYETIITDYEYGTT